MATVTKDFRIKSGLVVEGTTGTIDGSDIITAEKITGGDNIGVEVTYENGVVNFEVAPSEAITELAQDAVAEALAAGSHTNITVDYDDENNSISLTGAVTYTDEDARNAVSVDSTGPLTYNSTSGEFDLSTGTGLEVAITGELKVDETWLDTEITDGSRAAISAASFQPVTYNSSNGEIGFTLGSFNGGLGLDSSNNGLEIDRTVVDAWYDAAGSAAQALSDANDYTDDAVGAIPSAVLAIAGDTGTDSVTLVTDTLTFTGGDGIDIAVTDNTVTVDIDSTVATLDGVQTLTNKTLGADTSLSEDLDASENKIVNLADPVNAQDAATKVYVDSVAQGLDVKESVRVATTTDIPGVGSSLTEVSVVDGVTLANGDRVLVKNQADPAQNGIYVFGNAGVFNTYFRADDANEPDELNAGTFVFVEEGTTYGDTGWVVSSNNPLVIGTDPMSWTQFSGAGTYLAGTNLDLDGNTFSLQDEITLSTVNADVVGNVSGNVTAGDMSFNTGGIYNSTVTVYNASTGALVGNLAGNVTGSVDVNSGTIVNLSDPTDEQDAATKNYVDTELDSYLNSEEGTEGTTILYVQDYVETAIETGDATATPTYFALDVNSVAKQVAAQVNASTANVEVTAYSFTVAAYKSAKFLVHVVPAMSGGPKEVSEILLTVDGLSNIAITEYAVVSTNGSLASITADLDPEAPIPTVRLRVTPVNNNSLVTVYGTLLA
jgi:hypothetical protein